MRILLDFDDSLDRRTRITERAWPMDKIELDPSPSILIESMRDIGYSFETAVADIIDNSISARATSIRIQTRTAPKPILAVVDDGEGLGRDELLQAMRMGSTDPRKVRDSQDLGRFGLGLKTASFSQCRKLTVVSKCDGGMSAFYWDLDDVVETNNWQVTEIQGDDEILSKVAFSDLLVSDHGTLIVWEKIDRVVGVEGNRDNDTTAVFNRNVSDMLEHLSLVFHRFLKAERGYKRVSMSCNGREIEPIDPFNSASEATISQQVERLSGGVTIQSYTLPHASKYEDAADYEYYGLRGGYIKNQGIYLYRARRLIIHGTWFGLAKKKPLTQLCRVKIDIDNQHDEDWKIDVKKASAQLPENVRLSIKSLLNTLYSPSRRVYQRRGAKQVAETNFPLWNAIKDNGNINYLINDEHPLIADFKRELSTDAAKQFDLILKMLSAGFPIDSIRFEISNDPDSVAAPKTSTEEACENAVAFFRAMKGSGLDDLTILNAMRTQEIFAHCWGDVLSALGIEER